MNALGDSRRPLYYLMLSSAINIVLDILFIGGFHWGVWSGRRRNDDLTGHQHDPLPDPSFQKGDGVPHRLAGAAL